MHSLNKDTFMQRHTKRDQGLGILLQVFSSSSEVKGSPGYFANFLYAKIDTVFELTLPKEAL